MQLMKVSCWSEQHQEDDEPLAAVVIASDVAEAESLSKAVYRMRGFTRFIGEPAVDGLAGPPRVLGHTGQGAFSWRR
jgi:hypothetical protein